LETKFYFLEDTLRLSDTPCFYFCRELIGKVTSSNIVINHWSNYPKANGNWFCVPFS